MEYQKIINLLDNENTQPPKFNTKNKIKTAMLKSSFGDYINVYILVKGTITVAGQGANDETIAADKQTILNTRAPFTASVK